MQLYIASCLVVYYNRFRNVKGRHETELMFRCIRVGRPPKGAMHAKTAAAKKQG